MKLSTLTQPDVIALIVGIIGVILAIIFYYRSKISVGPCIAFRGTSIIGSAHSNSTDTQSSSVLYLPDAVEIRYNGSVIPGLYRASIAFWNAGRKTLDHADVASADPIEIEVLGEDVKLLEIRSKVATRKVTSIDFAIKGSAVSITFDFLDQNDGGACELFFTGDATGVKISGTVKGATKGLQHRTYGPVTLNRLSRPSWLPRFSVGQFSFPMAVLLAGLAYLAIGIAITVANVPHIQYGNADWVQFGAGVAAILFSVYCIASAFYIQFFRMPGQLWKEITRNANPPDSSPEDREDSGSAHKL